MRMIPNNSDLRIGIETWAHQLSLFLQRMRQRDIQRLTSSTAIHFSDAEPDVLFDLT
jgi:hypothetical protein